MANVMIIAAIAMGIALAPLLVIRIMDDRKVDRLWSGLQQIGAGEKFTVDMVKALPAPARRYFLHAIKPGTPLAFSVQLEMKGSFRVSLKKKWAPMRARQILAPTRGLIWKASIGGLLKITGYDRYVDGQGGMKWRLYGVIPLLNAGGPDINRSARGRLAAETCWVPSSLLPQRGIRWESVDDETVKAALSIDGEEFTLTLTVAEDGAPERVRLNRWGDMAGDGHFEEISFGAEFSGENSFGGYTVPTKISVGWRPGTDQYLEFFRAEVTSAVFTAE